MCCFLQRKVIDQSIISLSQNRCDMLKKSQAGNFTFNTVTSPCSPEVLEFTKILMFIIWNTVFPLDPWDLWILLVRTTYWSYVDKRHTKFVVSLPLNATQGSRRAVPTGRGWRNITQGSHAVASSSVGWSPYEMSDEKTGSLVHTLFIQGCPGSFTCLSTEHWVQGAL